MTTLVTRKGKLMLWHIAMILVVCDYSSYKEGEVDALAHSYDTGGM